jgi:hypothetical protein
MIFMQSSFFKPILLTMSLILSGAHAMASEMEIESWPPKLSTYTLDYILQKQAILDVVYGVFTCADNGDWEKIKFMFSDKVVLDYTVMIAALTGGDGGKPSYLTPQGVVDAWKSLLPGFQSVQHLIGNPLIEIKGKSAKVNAYVIATHILPNPSNENYWIVGGYYHLDLIQTKMGWKITRWKFNFEYDRGNRNLQTLAMEAVKIRQQTK